MGSHNLPYASALLTDLCRNSTCDTQSFATILNRRLLDADKFLAAADFQSSRPFRVAVVSLLFNWPSTGGGIVQTAELAQFLSLDGYEVCHFFAVYGPWSVGKVTESLTYNSCAIQFDEPSWNRTGIETAFRNSVDTFHPDAVIVTDSWNSRGLLASAVSMRWTGDGSTSVPMDPTEIDDVFSHGDIMAQLLAGTSASADSSKGRIGTIGSIGNAGGVYSANSINRIRSGGLVTANYHTAGFDSATGESTSSGSTVILENLTTLMTSIPKPVLDPSERDAIVADAAADRAVAEAQRLEFVLELNASNAVLQSLRLTILEEVAALRASTRAKADVTHVPVDLTVDAVQLLAKAVLNGLRLFTEAELQLAETAFRTERQKFVEYRDGSVKKLSDERMAAWEARLELQAKLSKADTDVTNMQTAQRDKFAAQRFNRQFFWEARTWRLAKGISGSGSRGIVRSR